MKIDHQLYVKPVALMHTKTTKDAGGSSFTKPAGSTLRMSSPIYYPNTLSSTPINSHNTVSSAHTGRWTHTYLPVHLLSHFLVNYGCPPSHLSLLALLLLHSLRLNIITSATGVGALPSRTGRMLRHIISV